MASSSSLVVAQESRPWRAIGIVGLVSGALDITAAFVTWAFLLKGIASGILGEKAFRGGMGIAALGLALHFFIAFSAAAVFYGASRKLVWMVRRPFLSGVSYGIAVYVFMYWIVLPLSRDVRGPFSISRSIVAAVTLIVCIGLPISWIVRRFSIPLNDRG